MKVILLTGAPGVGKSTLLPLLGEALPAPAAFLDGDAVGCTRPTERTLERLNLIQDNIVACARNFARWGATHLIAGYVLPSQERLERLRGLLRTDGFPVLAVALVADDEALVRRCRGQCDRPAWRHAEDEYIAESLGCNAGVKSLANVLTIDTTGMSPDDVVRTIAQAAGEDSYFR